MTASPGKVSSVLVVGGGLAGFHVAYALRRRGFTGQVTVVGAERHAPYDRPPLSKAFLAGTVGVDDLALDDPSAPLDVVWERAVGAVALVSGAGDETPGILTSDGRELRADAVVLATGADAIRIGPPVAGSHVLRTLDDAEALRADGVHDRDVVVVGTGFIGLEAAAVAVSLGAASVTVVAPEPVPLADRYGPEVGAAVQALHERRGVRFVTGRHVAGLVVDESGRAAGVTLDDGEPVPGDLVISGIGIRPATGWLAGCADLELCTGGAIQCSADGSTGAPGVWAMGDCAEWARADSALPRRRGHWQDALDQATTVAAAVLGEQAPPLPDPYCWSDQHDVRFQVAGHLEGGEVAVVRDGSAETGDLLVTFERDGVETAVLGMNRPRDVMRWRRTRAPRAGASTVSA